MDRVAKYPFSLRNVLHANQHENILDSNMFSAYIRDDLAVPRIEDPRLVKSLDDGIPRHPSYIKSSHINQIFSYIGYIRRIKDNSFQKYLPILFAELHRFAHVFSDIIIKSNSIITEGILNEQEMGLRNFLEMFNCRGSLDNGWIDDIWKNQKTYLLKVDKILMDLKRMGKVINLKNEDLYKRIILSIRTYLIKHPEALNKIPGSIDIGFVADCCAKAWVDREPKTIWSSDNDIRNILKVIYNHSNLAKQFPQIYQKAGYVPMQYKMMFPPRDRGKAKQKEINRNK